MKKLLLMLSLVGVVGLEAKTAVKTVADAIAENKDCLKCTTSDYGKVRVKDCTLQLSGLGITDLTGLDSSSVDINNIHFIDLSNNLLTSIQASDFEAFNYDSNSPTRSLLVGIDLSGNNISSIEKNTFFVDENTQKNFSTYLNSVELSGNCLSSTYDKNYIGAEWITVTLSNQRTTGCPMNAQPTSIKGSTSKKKK